MQPNKGKDGYQGQCCNKRSDPRAALGDFRDGYNYQSRNNNLKDVVKHDGPPNPDPVLLSNSRARSCTERHNWQDTGKRLWCRRIDKWMCFFAELPKDRPIVAYCRGPYCLMAKDAVELLRKKGFKSAHLRDGVAEWATASKE